MAETAITAVLSKLGELAVGEARLLIQLGDDIKLLRDQLEWLHAFVCDADRKRRAGTDGLTRVWVRQTRDVVLEAEDALDDFFYDEVIGSQGYGQVRKILYRYFTCFFTHIVVRHGMSGRIRSIKIRLDQISLNQKEFNIEHTPTVSSSSSTTAISAWWDDLENPVGFDEDVEKLLQMLRNDEMLIVSVIGESGGGKNTLAKIIRREMAMSPEMDIFVWYHMEPGCSEESFLRHLVRCGYVYKETRAWPSDEYKTLDEIPRFQTKLIGAGLPTLLRGKRYLLILSGLSSKNMLNSVRACLSDNGNGSHVMLILDTENEEVAWHANSMNKNGTNGVHLLPRLDQGRSGQLFFLKVLRKGQGSTSTNPKDSEYLRLVHYITGGYPMAIVLLAGLLRFKEKPAEWDAVLQQLKSDCETQDRQANLCGTRRAMEIIFWKSFEDLSNHLKSCFLYFAGYPKGYSYSADMIVQMWVAEGFIKQPEDGKTMEELGNNYLKELVSRCLVEVEEMKVGGGIKLVRVHKSLMGLLRTEAREAWFMEIYNSDDTLISPSVRRLSVQSGDSTFANKKFPKLRSFVCHRMIIWNERHDLKFLRWCRFIRVISIQGLNIEKLPGVIGDLINMRYLRIHSKVLKKIPYSVARLLNLQTLDISESWQLKEIVEDFWKIKTLRHVLAKNLTLAVTVPPVLPKDCGGSELQTLHGVQPKDSAQWSEGNCPLDNMVNLRSLEMHKFLYKRHGGIAFRTAVKKMHCLGHLHLEGDEIPSYILTHQNLQSLITMVLHGSIKWDDVMKELPAVDRPLRMVRPNLVQLKLDDDAIRGMPQSIKDQLEGILVHEG